VPASTSTTTKPVSVRSRKSGTWRRGTPPSEPDIHSGWLAIPLTVGPKSANQVSVARHGF
jgi:hypothetical protein